MVFDFFGPDAALLLSDVFVRDHCFSVVSGRRQQSTIVGLAFEPLRGRTIPDIAGVLWVERTSAELRRIDYRYTSLPHELLAERSEGKIEFARLPNARWIVSRWQIRTPRLAIIPDERVGDLSVGRRYEVIGYKEQGGIVEVLGLDSASSASSSSARRASVNGVAYDSLRGEPLVGVEVRLEGTLVRTTTDSTGYFRLGSPFPGEYTLSFSHPRLTRLGLAPVRRVVQLTLESDARVNISVPSIETLLNRCDRVGSSEPAASTRGLLLMGVVRQSIGGAAAPGARALIWWDSLHVRRSGTAIVVRQYTDTVDVQADSAGSFSVCGVPQEAEIAMRAIPNGPIVRRTYANNTRLAEVDLTLGVSTDQLVSIRGTIVSAVTGQVLSGAEVAIPRLARTTRTGTDGGFVLADVPPGRYDVQARRIGFTPAERTIATGQDDISQISFALAPLATGLPGLDIEARRDSANRQSEFERRRASAVGGTFVTRQMLAARSSSKLSDVLRTHAAGIRFLSRGMGGHAAASTRSGASLDVRQPRNCYLQIIIDGVRVFGPSQASPSNPPPDLDRYSLDAIESVEVYAGPADTPPEFAGADATCGTIVLSTRQA
jgi:hypothetical protein